MFQCVEGIFQIHIFICNEIVQKVFLLFQFQGSFTKSNRTSRISQIRIIFSTAHQKIGAFHRSFLKFLHQFFGLCIIFEFKQNLKLFNFQF